MLTIMHSDPTFSPHLATHQLHKNMHSNYRHPSLLHLDAVSNTHDCLRVSLNPHENPLLMFP